MATHKYRVREGFEYGAFGQHKAGSIIELDDETAKHVMDKVELAEVIQNVPPPGDEEPEEQVAEKQTVLPPGVPPSEEIPPAPKSSTIRKTRTTGD